MDATLYLARFVHYCAALQLCGVACFQALLAPPALRAALDQRSRALSLPTAILLVASALLWLLVQAAAMGDGWPDALNLPLQSAVLSSTSFGRVWSWHLAFCLLAAIAAIRPGNWPLLLLLATLVLCSLGLVGHAAIESGTYGLLNRVSQMLHLLSSAFWLGSLVPLLFCLCEFRKPGRFVDADTALRRFSGFGHLAVAILLGTGVANTWFVLRGSGLEPSSLYQQLLGMKIVIVLVMIGLAVVNRYVFVPRIPRGPGISELAHGTVAELAMSGALIGIVAVLGTLAPG